MLIADIETFAPFFSIGFFIVLGVIVLYLFRGYERWAHRSLERKYRKRGLPRTPQAGDVLLSYHTYHGFIACFTQTHHAVYLPPQEARKLLGQLLRFNLTWGLVTYGSLLMIPLAIGNYVSQHFAIAKQVAAGGWTE